MPCLHPVVTSSPTVSNWGLHDPLPVTHRRLQVSGRLLSVTSRHAPARWKSLKAGVTRENMSTNRAGMSFGMSDMPGNSSLAAPGPKIWRRALGACQIHRSMSLDCRGLDIVHRLELEKDRSRNVTDNEHLTKLSLRSRIWARRLGGEGRKAAIPSCHATRDARQKVKSPVVGPGRAPRRADKHHFRNVKTAYTLTCDAPLDNRLQIRILNSAGSQCKFRFLHRIVTPERDAGFCPVPGLGEKLIRGSIG